MNSRKIILAKNPKLAKFLPKISRKYNKSISILSISLCAIIVFCSITICNTKYSESVVLNMYVVLVIMENMRDMYIVLVVLYSSLNCS